MRIAVIGSGYVGLVSGACLADFGHDVVGVDRDDAKIGALSEGRMPIYEPGLDALVTDNIRQGRLRFTTDLRSSVAGADAVFIAVGTPTRRSDGFADLSQVRAAAREIAEAVTGYTVVVTKSTVPVGTGDEVERIVRGIAPHADISVVSNPEFLREGSAIDDFKRPDRIVIGCEERRAETLMREIYRPLYLNAAPIVVTGRRTAELTKYAANAFLATKITFINEIADLCDQVGANVQDVALGIGLDNRIGRKFLHAGPGYGGSCFPKDTLALVKTARDHGVPVQIVETVISVNAQRVHAMARKIVDACGGSVRGKTVALLGLTFKPNTDDMRDAPSLTIVAGLQEAGAAVRVYDPEGMEQARSLLAGVAFARDPYDCATGADVLVIVTEWNAFRALDFGRLHALMAEPRLVDLRNIYPPAEAERAGFAYTGIGTGRSGRLPRDTRRPRRVREALTKSGPS